MPLQPPPRSTSAFATASKRYSQAPMLNLAAGHPDMAFRAGLSNSWAIETSKITRPATRACSLPCSCTPLRLQRIPADGSVRVGSIQWDDTAHDVFIFRRLTRFMMFTGFRLAAETVSNGSGEIMFLTYGCLFWCVDNVMIAKPSRAQLLGMRPGRDGAVVFPPRSPNQISGGRRIARSRSGSPTKPQSSTPQLPSATSSFTSAGRSPTGTATPPSGTPRSGLTPDDQHRA